MSSSTRPLVEQAAATARALRLTEGVQRVPDASRSVQFNMERVLHAMNKGDQLQRVQATYALQSWLSAPDVMRRSFPGQVREMVTAGSMPVGATLQAYIDRFLVTGLENDLGYTEIFQMHDQAQAEGQLLRNSFKILDVKSGLTWKLKKPGEPVQFMEITGSDVSYEYDMFGGGVSIDRQWWDDQDYMNIADTLTMFRETAYGSRAANLYGLITALGAGVNFATGADLAAKINGACAKILRASFGKGNDAPATTPFVILYSPEMAGTVDTALNLKSDTAVQTSAGKQAVQYRFIKVPSTYVGAADGPYVILPKRKLKAGIRMDVMLYGQFNIASYADDIAGFQRYKGAIGDSTQIARIT